MGRLCSTPLREEDCVRGLVGKPEGKRALRKPRRRWEDNIKIDIREILWGGIHLAQDIDQWRSPVNTATNVRIP
jgi:hypothetical protein